MSSPPPYPTLENPFLCAQYSVNVLLEKLGFDRGLNHFECFKENVQVCTEVWSRLSYSLPSCYLEGWCSPSCAVQHLAGTRCVQKSSFVDCDNSQNVIGQQEIKLYSPYEHNDLQLYPYVDANRLLELTGFQELQKYWVFGWISSDTSRLVWLVSEAHIFPLLKCYLTHACPCTLNNGLLYIAHHNCALADPQAFTVHAQCCCPFISS